MKITKFAQACILIEAKGKRILVDPGFLQFDESLLKEGWNDIDILLVTHRHDDHCHIPAIQEIMKNQKTTFYTTQEVASEFPELQPERVKEGDRIDAGGITIEVVRAVHGFIPWLKGGAEITENVGYILDDGEKRVYVPSDTICFDNDYTCDIVFVPVCNHGLVMGPFEAALFAKETGAKHVIPFHYDNPKFPANLEQVKEEFKKQGLNFRFLDVKERIEI